MPRLAPATPSPLLKSAPVVPSNTSIKPVVAPERVATNTWFDTAL